MDRLNYAPDQKSVVYGSVHLRRPDHTPRGYLGDPTKIRLMHVGAEMFHVFHLHGGGDRWRFNPLADPTYDYGKTGLDKHPVEVSDSERLDSQSIGPGESYNLEIEGGAGGVQQGAGDFLFHCHIAHHYVSGMWGFWRVYNTLQPDLMPLPDRDPLSQGRGLLRPGRQDHRRPDDHGRQPRRLDPPAAPAPGRHAGDHGADPADTADQDASVWDWSRRPGDRALPRRARPRHGPIGPARGPALAGLRQRRARPSGRARSSTRPSRAPTRSTGSRSTFTAGGYVGTRPKILFDQTNGRPAYPLFRTNVGKRPPFSHRTATRARPYLGEYGGQGAVRDPRGLDQHGRSTHGQTDPTASARPGAPLRTYNVVGHRRSRSPTATRPRATKVVDPLGALDVLAEDKAAVYAGTKVYAGVQQHRAARHPRPTSATASRSPTRAS